MFLDACRDALHAGGGNLSSFDMHAGWHSETVPQQWLQRSDFLDALFCSFDGPQGLPLQGLPSASAGATASSLTGASWTRRRPRSRCLPKTGSGSSSDAPSMTGLGPLPST